MKTRWAPGCNRRRQGDTDEWLKVCSLQLEGEGGLSGCVCDCVFVCVSDQLHSRDLLDYTLSLLYKVLQSNTVQLSPFTKSMLRDRKKNSSHHGAFPVMPRSNWEG